ncbi:MAG: poly(beta-D-mannuronate) O-acetylase [Phenylobacterium sp.]|uniref:MBOAT family O-acyltransferase n=1 Tax=Phenylobacterium sp. TaxID=1871053 RepID=UPI002623BC7A|nr:MBOAT family O-acyltransferase [Phenylobacterium sp.]MDB5498524.1 poly(beta-D-mannuronate) O-acetylase [Phenylobacterium sp.]
MVFSSVIFIFYFLPFFLLGYYVSGWRAGALLAGSAAFYVWGEGAYVFLLLGLIGLNYTGSRWVDATVDRRRRVAILASLVVVDFAVLGFFKYSEFLAHNLNRLLPNAPLPEVHQALPLGISFFTFQLVSYAIDVHRGSVKVERDLTRFAAYILMFPHLIAGPIVRYADIRDEMHGDRRKTAHIGLGVQYFIVGLCQKVLIANTVAPLADHAFAADLLGLDATTAWLGVWAYTLQIYFDFCGYSNMAIGLAFLLGFTFPKNFDYPYAAQSITDFWRRWHMSLSSWFRDYVYIPLGGNRGGQLQTVRNLLIVFFLTGLWHGAAWRFIVWGLYHGGFLMLERFGFGRALQAAPRPLRRLYAVLVVMVGWVFFRADSLPDALHYLAAMAQPGRFLAPDAALSILLNAQSVAALAAGTLLAAPLLPALMERLRARRAEPPRPDLPGRLETRSVYALPIPLLAAGFVISIAILVGSTLNPFLYFRF